MPLLLSHPRYRYAPTVPSSSDSHPETAIVVVGSDAALRSLGRSGVTDLLESCCAHARHFAEALAQEPGVEVLNDVVLNQVLMRFLDPGGTTTPAPAPS